MFQWERRGLEEEEEEEEALRKRVYFSMSTHI